jgi:CubicO group peptidase (beta-lactamase class C family)
MQKWNNLQDLEQNEKISSLEELYESRLDLAQRVKTIRNLDRFFPCHQIKQSLISSSISYEPFNFENFNFLTLNQNLTLDDYIRLNYVTGICILKNGIKIYENYFNGNNYDTQWCGFSITKSITSTLIGAAIQDGSIGGVGEQVSTYLPQLDKSIYGEVTIEQVLRMCSGVQWDETYSNPNSDRRKMLEVQHLQQTDAVLNFLSQLPRKSKPGDLWNYNTGDTFIAGALLKAAIHKSLSTYLQEKIWQPLGMEFPASWWLDSINGQEFGGGGLSFCLRDLARFGQFLLDDGMINGSQILPADWVKNSSTPFQVKGKSVDYGYLFWLVPPEKGAIHQGAFKARGIFGQYLYVNPHKKIVVATFGARPKPRAADSPIDDDDFLTGLVQYLN